MLATTNPLPTNESTFSVEFKYDGFRLGGRRHRDGRVRLDSRGGRPWAAVLPEVAKALGVVLTGRRVVLDGEAVAPDPDTGAPDFARLQRRLGINPSAALLAEGPVTYLIFDLLELDGQPTVDLPYLERRRLLAELALTHPRLVVPPHHLDVPMTTLLRLAAEHQLEGIVVKRRESTYRPGRSPAWVKAVLSGPKSSSADGYRTGTARATGSARCW
jgi:bifunctional non-homologous end joining protein LigD